MLSRCAPFLFLGACGGYQGQWLFSIPGMTVVVGESEVVDHNFNGAQPIQDEPQDTGGESDWTTTEETTSSPSLMVAEIAEMEGGQVIVVLGDAILPGTKEGGVYTFAWDSYDDVTESERHTSGYEYTRVVHEAYITTLTFDPGAQTGTVAVESVEEFTLTESDAFDAFDVGSSQLYESNYYLEMTDGGYVENDPSNADCGDAVCTLQVRSSEGYSGTFTAQAVSHDGFSGAGQD